MMSAKAKETVPEETAAPAKPATKKKSVNKTTSAPSDKKKKSKKKGKGPGKYSQLVINAIKTLAERNGSSLFKIYNEAKNVSWFDQQHGRVYLRYSIRALLQNDSLVQVKGLGANGSFKLNKKKFTTDTKKVKKTKQKQDKRSSKKSKERKKRVSGVKKATSGAMKTTKAAKADKGSAVAARKASKPKKAKQPYK